MRRLSEADAAALFPDQDVLSPPAASSSRDGIQHILSRNTSTGAFRVGDEATAVRFALDVVRVRAAAAQWMCPHAGTGSVPDAACEEQSFFLLRVWGHVGSSLVRCDP